MDEDSSLVRDVMVRTTDGLGPLPDLVPGAVTRGRRRRARARLVITAGAFGAVTLVTLGTAALAGLGPGSDTVRFDTGVAAAPYRTPAHVAPTGGPEEEGSLTGLSADERRRLEDFQQRAAVALDAALPDEVGMIRPVDSSVALYQGERDGNVFLVNFTVRPLDGQAARACRSIPAKRLTCEKRQLTETVEASLRVAAVNSPDTTSTSISFDFGNSTALIDVSPDEGKGVSAPVTARQLLDGVRESGLLDVVRYADEHPVLEKQVSVRGG
ncbi:hypothetical protein [Streptomyces pratensis]|uniref:hypothetical protein n=1 Tax=Streptomyces pratensis TaxID=1169025 RepID=UPI00363D90C0